MSVSYYPAPTHGTMTGMSGTITSHFPAKQPLLRDGFHAGAASDDERLLTDVRVRSGDYIITLATELDKLAQNLTAVQAPEAPEIERLVSELLYIHQTYQLVKK